MTITFFSLAGVAVAVVTFLLLRKKPKVVAPEATFWIGPIGLVSFILPNPSRFVIVPFEFVSIVANMESFLGKQIAPVVVAFIEGLIPLADGRTAAGVYHSADLWTHAWIELSVGGGDWWPTTLRETAFEHELLHHAAGLEDSEEFKALFARYREQRPV